MILIPCPHCGPRNSAEFRYVGEATARPDPSASDATAWRTYLYFRRNPAGWTTETWFHRMGCRRFFQVERDTVSNQTRGLDAAGRQAERQDGQHPDATTGEAP